VRRGRTRRRGGDGGSDRGDADERERAYNRETGAYAPSWPHQRQEQRYKQDVPREDEPRGKRIQHRRGRCNETGTTAG
jgi:hypothetical protein